MNRLLSTLTIFFLLSLYCSKALGQDINWVETAGGVSNDHGRAIQTDGAGNLYVLGHFSAPSATFGSTSLTTAGTGTYLAKYSNTGKVLWVNKISDTNVLDAGDLKIDASGNSYVVTTFAGTTALGGKSLTSSGASDIVVAKYNTNGGVVWATLAGGAASETGFGIAIDAAGNSFITGSFSGASSFGSANLSSAGSTDGFVAKLNADGSFAWAKNVGGSGEDNGRSIVADASGTVYVAGNFNGDFSLGTTTLTHSGKQDIFLVAYSSAGVLRWAKKAGDSNADEVTSLAIDGAGNLYLGGNFTRSTSFGGISISGNGNSQDIFLAKYTSTGTSVWAKAAGGKNLDELGDIHADTNGNLYLTGSYSGAVTLAGMPLKEFGGLDIFAAHYLSDGTAQWAIGAGSAVDDRGLGISSDAGRNVYVTGYFQGNTTNFGGIVIPNRGGEEIFVSKLIPALVTTNVTPGPYCAGQAITVSYKASQNFNTYSVQLSDANGSFANPVPIGATVSNNTTGTIAATIPADTPAGSKYRIRVVASAYGLAGTDNGTDLTVNPVPAPPVVSASSPGVGGNLFLTASGVPGATYSWTGPNGFTSNEQNPTRPGMTAGDAGTYTVTMSVNGCTSTASVTVVLADVPTFDVDLRGNPNGFWDSPAVKRAGSVCGDDNCVVFNVLLDPASAGLELEIPDGSIPPGSMFYEINCDMQAPVGEPICIENTGIIQLSLCKPGNNKNVFRIKSISPYDPQGDISVTAGCSASLTAPLAFNEASIVWKDVTGGGEYLKYLDYTSGKRTVTVSPDDNAPAYVDYAVSGTSMQSPCSSTPYEDTIRVYFYPPPTITIGPEPAILCPDGSGVTLVSEVTGGDGNWDYIWTDPFGNVVGTQPDYTATNVGTYKLEVRNSNYPNCREFSASVEVVSNLAADAGPDQLVCSQNGVQLNGVVTAALGGVWSGGGGSFSPSNTDLNAVYTPTAAELAAGSVNLTLTSTGNGSCSAVLDDVLITFYPIDVELTGTPVICSGTLGTVTANVTGGNGTISYKWSSGETTPTITGKAAGTYTVSITDGQSCAVEKSFTVTEVTGPSGFTAAAASSTCGASNGSVSVSSITDGTAPYTYSIDGATYQAQATLSGLAAGNYTVYVKDANGCSVAQSVTITDIAGPTAVAATSVAASCANNDGSITVGTVTGGTSSYTYSINGTSFQSAASFTGLAAGTYTLTAKDANGCTVTTSVTVSQNVLSSFASTTAPSTCGSDNGSVTLGKVTGGFAPYTYSRDGVNFQASATLTGFVAGSHTITVKDAKGCTFSKSITITDVAGPTDLAATAKASTCGDSNAEITVTGVTGGTGTYTYSIDGTAFQSSATFTGLAAGNYTVYVQDGNGCTYSEVIRVTNIAGPAFTATAQASTCGASNGNITVNSPTAGTAPFKYSKDGSTFQDAATFTNLAAGTYNITVKDANGCTLTQAVEVTDIEGPSDVALTSESSTCGASNASITVGAVTGGTPTYTYSIDGKTFQASASFGSLAAGDYTITVKDANSCTFSKTITVTDIAGPTDLTATTQATTCGSNNGEITITGVTGGTGDYTYSKDGVNFQATATLTGFVAGSHMIFVKDANGCTFSKSFTVADIAGPTAVAATSQPASCNNNDGSISVGKVTGGTSGYTYSIDGTNFQSGTSFTGLASGNYTVTAKDANGCAVTTSVTVTKQTLTSFNLTAQPSTCGASNASITVSNVLGGFAPYTYSTDGVNFQASGTLSGLAAGAHTVTVKDARGCTLTKNIIISNIPGPADLRVTTKASTCGASNAEITVANVTGGSGAYTYSIDGVNFQASASFTGLAAGNYTVSVKDGNGCVYAEAVDLTNIAGPEFTATATASTCGASNGSISVNDITGGTAPYTYSVDGSTYQTSNTFGQLLAGTYNITVKDANGCTLVKAVTVSDVAGPSDVALTSQSSTCGDSNGSISVGAVTGGTSTYTYSIDGKAFQTSSTFGNLLAGDYTVTVKDANGCTITKTIAVTDVAGPSSLTANATSSTCGASNGELTVTGVTGGTAPYTYSKDGTAFSASVTLTGFAAGTHTIYAKDANGCVVSGAFTVTDIAGPTAVAATSQPASCNDNDGSILVGKVTGGTSAYTYSIDGASFQSATSFTGLAAGTYTLTAKDANGCTVTTTVTVRTNKPTNFASTTAPSTCGSDNGSVTLGKVTGGFAPYTYSRDGVNFQASATLTGFVAGTHTITVKDAKGCTFSKAITVTDIAGPSDLATAATASTCGNSNGEFKVSGVTGGTMPYAYSIDGTNFQESDTFAALGEGIYIVTVKDANGCTYAEEVAVSNIAGPSFTLSAQASTCGASNGSITVNSPTGGTAPYSYAINNGSFQSSATFSGLVADDYNITVKDANGCTLTQAVAVTDIAGPSGLELASASSTCGAANGSITVGKVTGGTAPYTYSLAGAAFQSSQEFENVLAGTYTITVKDANGCTFSASITVTDIAGPTDLTATSRASTCGSNNGELTVSGVTGGVAPYTYSKDGVNYQASATLTGFVAGSHTIFVKDANGCTFSKSFTVTDIAGPTAVAATSQPASCQDNDGSITVGAVTGGTSGYTYSINGTDFQSATSFTGLASGTYTLTSKDANGCIITTSVKVNQNVPKAFASTSVAATCGRPDGELTIGNVTGGTAPYTYSINGGSFQVSATFTDLAAGSYSITVKDAKGCTFTDEVGVSNVAGPVITAKTVASTCSAANGSIRVSNTSGGVSPYTYSIDGENFQSSTTFANLQAGTYTVTVKDANGCAGTVSVVLEDIAGPSDFALAGASSTCGASNATISVSDVDGGTAPYTYSKDGSNFQSSATFASLAAGEYTITVKDANGCTITKDIEVEDIAGPDNLALASTASTCGDSNGKIEVAGVTGGTAPYVFSLDGGSFQSELAFENVLAGEYTVTVKDANSCTFATSITVGNLPGPTSLTASATASTCGAANGTLTITEISGGQGPYTYALDGGNFGEELVFEYLMAGSHTITVKDVNGCVLSKSFTVTDIAGPSAVAATSQPASCQNNDGSISVGKVTGGTSAYTYSINGTTFQSSTSFTGLASGDYTVTVKDANGCTVTTSVKVNQNVPTNFASTTVASTCGASNASITVGSVTGGTAPYTYSTDGKNFQASATLDNLAAGTHRITVKDAKGCTFSKEVSVEDIAGPSALALAGKASTCGSTNATITVSGVTGGTAPYTFSIDGSNFQSGTSFGSLLAGDYTVTVKDANGCTYVQAITLEDIPGPSAFTASATASSCGRANGSITVTAVTDGTAPYTYSADGTNFQEASTLTGLLAGEHIITVKDANGCTVTMAVTVEDVAGPSGLELASTASTCGAANGSITVGKVTGGTAPYTYSMDGSAFQSGLAFSEVLAGEYTVTVKDTNGCTFSAKVTVEDIAGPTNLTASTTSTTCGASNGAISITGVTGGTAPYTYSIDGTNFQAAAAFAELAAGTHNITVKDANGCTYVKAIEVTNLEGPSAIAATTRAASCADNDGSITVGNITGGTAPYTYSINGKDFQSATSFTGLASGEYTITVKDANGCETTETMKVSKEGPADFAASTAASTCGGENGRISVVSVEGGVAPYTYSINGGSFQSSASFVSLLAGTYSITVKDANGCTYTDEVELTNIEGPSDLTASATTATCGNSNGQINVSAVTGGTAPYTYSKDGVNFQASATISGLAAGEYQVTVKDANGCTVVKAVTVANASGPEGFTVAGKATTCGAANGEATVSAVVGGKTPYTYSKDGTNFQPETTLTGLAAGSHTITVKDANGCTFIKQVVIENIAGPANYELATVATTCGAANGSITVSNVSGGTAPYSYALNEGSFQTSAAFAEVSAGEHTITVKDANGCTLVKQVTVTDVAGPAEIAAATTPTACTANNGTITVNGVTGGTAPYSYSLDGNSYQAAANFGSLAAGEYEVYVKDANGCSFSIKVTVGVKGPKEAAVAATDATCGEENGSITITSVTDGTKPLAYSIDGTTYQASATFASLAAGVYTITVKDAEGCTLEVTQEISNSGGATFVATGTDASCGTTNGRIVISDVSGSVSPYTYSVDGITFQNSPEFTGLAEGEYQVTVKDAAGCMNFEAVTIGNTPPITDLKATVSAPTCDQPSGQIKVDEVVGGTAPYTYSIDGTNFTASTTLADVAPGAYTLTVKDASGCTYSIEVQVEEGVSSELDYVHHLACSGGNTGEIAFKSTGANDQTQYSIDNGKTFQKDAVFKELAAGTYQLIAKFSASCTIQVGTVEVKEAEQMDVEVMPLTKAIGFEKSGSAAVTKISGGVGPYTYSLDGGSFSSDSVFTNLGAQEYTVRVRDSRGCEAEATFVIEGIDDIDIPNGFTPNGDGRNDTWVLKNLARLYPNCSVSVYNRWGSPVFTSKGYAKPWDGTYNGKRLPDGTYYCIIELGDGSAPIKSSITIMR
ncbi:T9SS type B sorting domain-containing protein [Pontibacter mangrovi]|uniref:T9SS type B sorting domain-containing protein n=1 Tax=Pontibacter mangrovi TaxID=2589816 RepID=A0A501WAI2_9BACT|nr:gliding motility-associated C-terminal domain-containing protein [Pontibacter mangrovi]TPE42586.1 T9SS type B sorting domain-containing protein [Pontibacter mangrovi]